MKGYGDMTKNNWFGMAIVVTRCPNCQKPIVFMDMTPVVLTSKCDNCQKEWQLEEIENGKYEVKPRLAS
jgi:uncharacterized protein (DUF983 family)